jgi:DNA-binding CsgD family transcriptional regulator/PAS domain-containing protein
VRSYQEYYAAKNPLLIYGRDQLQPGTVSRRQSLCPDDIFLRSEFHEDWAAPQKMGQAVTATVLKTPAMVGLFGLLQRLDKRGPDEADLALLRALMPHLQRAVKLHSRMADLHVREQVTQDALDRCPVGVILLNGEGRVVLMNRSAEEIVRSEDGLAIGPQGLRANGGVETTRLREVIRLAIARSVTGPNPGGVLTLSRATARQPLHLLVAPLASSHSLLPQGRAGCIVFVTDPDAEPESDIDLLRRLYGLTAAEAKVAAFVVRGKDVKGICDELRVSPNTVRTHLKRVFEKTNTKRQAELVSLILRGPAGRRSISR